MRQILGKLVHPINFHVDPPMFENKENKNAPFNPLLYEEENFDYPSDRLELGHLRRLWPEPDDLGESIGRVRFLEHFFAEGVAVDIDHAASGKSPPDPKDIKGLHQKDNDDRRYLKEFYITTGLASGDHAAELLIRGIEERARMQYQPKLGPR